MSDIYLQITETPTVVTLSQPVIATSVAATVTVGNTVTVALDANSLSALENVTVTVGAAITGTVTVANSVTAANIAMLNASVATDGVADGTLNFFKIGGHQSGANQTAHVVHVSAGGSMSVDATDSVVSISNFPTTQPVSIASVTIGSALPAGTNTIGVVTIGNIRRSGDGALSQLSTEAGSGYLQTVIGAGTSQIGSVTASISGTVPVSISSVTVGNSVTIGSLPAISGTVTVGAVSTTVTIAHHQGTSVTTSNFTSTTASTTLASANANREVLTIFNEGAGNLHICAGATCTTIAYQVRLSAGEYYEVPLNQTSLTHSAVFATAGTARVTQIS